MFPWFMLNKTGVKYISLVSIYFAVLATRVKNCYLTNHDESRFVYTI